MKIVHIKPADIGNMLLTRKEPKMITYELGDWSERKISDLEKFKKSFFEDNYCVEENLEYELYIKNILHKSDYGSKAIPEITSDKIECMLVYSTYGNMIDNFTITEFNKIRKLLEKQIVQIDKEFLKDREDDYGRKVINTKYRLLNLMYNKHK